MPQATAPWLPAGTFTELEFQRMELAIHDILPPAVRAAIRDASTVSWDVCHFARWALCFHPPGQVARLIVDAAPKLHAQAVRASWQGHAGASRALEA